MAKKKQAEKAADVCDADAGDVHAGEYELTTGDVAATTHNETADQTADETLVEAATPAYIADEAAFLAAEVQAFLSKRGELSERLSREIEATERRLEELRRALALLSPSAGVPLAQPAKPEKKAKKPTLKKAEKKSARHDTAGDETAANTNASGDDAAEPANPQANNGAAA
jgi:hypothetical protein